MENVLKSQVAPIELGSYFSLNLIKFILMVFLLLVMSFHSYSQQEEPCGTLSKSESELKKLPWYGNNNYLNLYMDSIERSYENEVEIQLRDGNECYEIETFTIIPIQFWFYRANEFDLGFPSDIQTQEMMDELNAYYQTNGMKVRFISLCPNFVTDPNKVVMNDWEAYWNDVWNGEKDLLNIYVIDELEGATGVYNSVGDFIAVRRSVFNGTTGGVTTLAHEIGHYFGLDHTHRNSDAVPMCSRESVSRTRKFSFWDFIGCGFKSGKICEKNGDGLCDTEADPNLSGKVSFACNYTSGEIDPWGDTYNPNTYNLMSYSLRPCRNWFSNSQRAIMWKYIITKNNGELMENDAETIDPDQYEPDNAGLNFEVPRAIRVGETQCHSFHSLYECFDPIDYLKIENAKNIVGEYIFKVENFNDSDCPVSNVVFYNTDALGNRTSELIPEIIDIGSTRLFKIQCDEITNEIIIEISRKSPDLNGIYKVSLNNNPELKISNNSDLVCTGDIYSILNLPPIATVIWDCSWNITLSNYQGATTSIASFTPNSSNYWFQAIINFNGCQQIIRKDFIGVNGDLPSFEIVELIAPCFPPKHPYGRYQTNPYTPVTWSVNYGSVSGSNSGLAIYKAASEGLFTLSATATNDCGNQITVSKDFYIEKCDYNCFEEIAITQNFTNCSMDVNLGPFISGSTYHYAVTDSAKSIIMTMKENMTSLNFSLDVTNFPTGNYNLHLFCEEGYSEKQFPVDNPTLCDLEIIKTAPCDLSVSISHCNIANQLPVKWKDPNGNIIISNNIINANINGLWTAFIENPLDLDCHLIGLDTVILNNCESVLSDSLCTSINDNASGNGDWYGSYISDGNGILNLDFYTATVPDQLIVSINGIEVANSGNYSSNSCSIDYGSCIGTVNYGCGIDYITNIPVSFNDYIELKVFGNTCNANNTYWSLDAMCYGDSLDALTYHSEKIRIDDRDWTGEVIIFPNPTDNEINIITNSNLLPFEYELIDVTGKKVLSGILIDINTTINTSQLGNGMYLFSTHNHENKSYHKIIVNK